MIIIIRICDSVGKCLLSWLLYYISVIIMSINIICLLLYYYTVIVVLLLYYFIYTQMFIKSAIPLENAYQSYQS